MKNSPTDFRVDLERLNLPDVSELEMQLLNIYWCKKELEEFLPQISSYANPREMSAITLSQLAVMEKQLLEVLHQIARADRSNMH